MAFNFCNRLLECTYACGSWLPMIAYMSWGCSTQLAQYSDVCMTTQGYVRPVKEQAGTELNLNTA